MPNCHPALLQGKKNIPNERSILNPTQHAFSITVGTREGEVDWKGAKISLPAEYTAYQLPEGVSAEVTDEVGAFINEFMATNLQCRHSGTVCTQMLLIKERENFKVAIPSPDPCSSRECPYFIGNESGNVLAKFMKDGLIARLISHSVCGDDTEQEFFRKNMTMPQMFSAARDIYDANFNLEATLPEDTVKKLSGLLQLLGVMRVPEEASIEEIRPLETTPSIEQPSETSPKPEILQPQVTDIDKEKPSS